MNNFHFISKMNIIIAIIINNFYTNENFDYQNAYCFNLNVHIYTGTRFVITK